MKKIILIFLITIGSVNAQTISLTCMGKEGDNAASGNYTIIAPSANSKGKIFIQDKDLNSSSQYGVSTVTEIVVTNSEIKWSAKYNGNAMTYPDPRFNVPARSSYDEWVINRTSGQMRRIITDPLENPSVRVVYSYCELRRQNKF